METKKESSISELSLSITDGRVDLKVFMPRKWFFILIVTLLIWWSPELWSVIQTAISLFGG